MVKSILKEDTKDGVVSQEVSLDPESSYKIKPRAIIFKADYEDLDKIKGLIKTQFPNVKIVYVTTGPAKSILYVTKSMPLKAQNSEQSLFTVE